MEKNLRTIVLCLFLFLGKQLLAQPMGWGYTVPITIIETGGANQGKFQARFQYDTETEVLAGRMNADGSDIRMSTNCAGTDTVGFFIENYMNTDSTVFWLLIDSLDANDTMTVFMFFGNTTATTASDVNIFNGPHSSTDSVISPSTNSVVSNSSRGYIFSPNTEILVHHFGKREPTGTTRYVTLWDVATQTIIHQDTVPGGAGSYYYRELDTSMWLQPGVSYILSLFQGNGDGYYYGTSSQVGQHITYGGSMRYCNNCTQNTYPTSTLTNYHYGNPDFWYYIKDLPTSQPSIAIGALQSMIVADAGADTTLCSAGSVSLNGIATGGNGNYTYLWSPGATLSDSTILNPSLNLSGSATFMLQVWDGYGCTSSDSVTLTALQSPIVDLGADTSFCDGGSATLMNMGSTGSYLWSNGDTTSSITVGVSGDYALVVTDSNGCTGSDTVSVTVNANPTAVFSSTANLLTVDFFDISLPVISWAWDFGDGNTSSQQNPTHTYAAAGSYIVCLTVSDGLGCSGTTCDTVNVVSVGISNALSAETVLVYPNPFTGIAKIKVTLTSSTEGSLRLTDIYGKEVQAITKQVFNAGEYNFELSSEKLASGVYFLNFDTDLGKITKKVIVK